MATSAIDRNLGVRDFQSLLERSSDLIGLMDSQGDLKAISRSWIEKLNLPSEELLHTGWKKSVHPHDLRGLLDFFSRAVQGKASGHFEARFIHRKQQTFWYSWSATFLPDKNLLFCTAQDISERKSKELSREKSDRLLRQTIDAVPVLVAYMDLNFQYLYMNAVYEKWVGNHAQSIREGNLEKAVGSQSAQALWAHREKVIHTGKPSRFEITFKNTDCEERILDVSYYPDFNQRHELEGLMVLGVDVTDIRRANDEIRKTQSRLNRVLNDGRIGYWELQFQSNIVLVSENIRRRLGYGDQEVLDRNQLLARIHPEDRDKWKEARQQLENKGQSFEMEFRLLGNRESWVYCTANPTYSEDGEMIGMMGVSIDVTERKKMEQILRLQQAQMTASSRLSALGEMASGVAHEINNPLAIIMSNAESLKLKASHGQISPQIVEGATRKIESTVMRIAKIIRSLRSLSRESERDPLEPVTLLKVIEDVLEICNQRFINNEIDLSIDLQIGDIQLMARPSQISQVLLNLLNNAFDAVEKSTEKWVKVTAQDLGDFVEIAVTDSGPGIPESLQERVFDPFFTTKEPTKGTGLGLSVSKSLIQAHGGTLSINSESPHTQFVIRLPKKPKSSE